MSGKKLAIPLFVGGLFLFIVVTSAGVLFVISSKNSLINNTTNTTTTNTVSTNTPAKTVSTPVSTTTVTTVPTSDIASSYKDGTYTVESSYYTPDDTAAIKVSLTLASGKISNVNVVPEAYGESGRYQTRFASAVSAYIVGKQLDSAALRVNVSGASLTTDAFNVALTKIKAQALV